MMPCTGPTKPTDAEVDKVLQRVLQVLKDDFAILSIPEKKLIGGFATHRRKAIAKLKKGIAEVMWQDECENF